MFCSHALCHGAEVGGQALTIEGKSGNPLSRRTRFTLCDCNNSLLARKYESAIGLNAKCLDVCYPIAIGREADSLYSLRAFSHFGRYC